ncbi:ABC transporter substrate-binding protein [Candidatus Parcubacteria bacterium]|nr:MAG: ABC transporter substrate-binding protein [Candidatus Parcubacteria bacterium]
MTKNTLIKKISLLILLVTMVGCIPMSEATIDKKAASVAESTIARKEREKEKLEAERQKKRDKAKKDYDLADEQILNISGRSFVNLEPTNANSETLNLISLVFPGLTRYNAASGEFLPVLAESWEVSEDLLTWTFILRDDIPWVTYNAETEQIEQVMGEDAEPLYVTAEDVKTRIMEVLDPNEYTSNYYLLLSIAGAIDYTINGAGADTVQIETPSDSELIIHLANPDSGFLAVTELPAFSAAPSWDFPKDISMVENFYGPFVPIDPISFNYNSVTIIKNPFWLGTEGMAEPFLETININMQYGQDVLSAFRNGELDAVSLNNEEYLEALSDLELVNSLVTAPGDTGYYLVFNNLDFEPIDDADARKMVAAGIDKTTLSSLLVEKSGTPLQGIMPDFFHDEPFVGIPYNEDFTGIESDSPSAALAYMDFFYVEDGTTLIVSEILTDSLSKILDMEINLIPEENMYQLINDMENIYFSEPGVYLMNLYLRANDPGYVWKFMESDSSIAQAIGNSWENEEFMVLFEQAKSEIDPSKRSKLYEQMEEIIVNEDAVIIPLFWTEQHWLIRSDVGADILPLYQQLENWARIKL